MDQARESLFLWFLWARKNKEVRLSGQKHAQPEGLSKKVVIYLLKSPDCEDDSVTARILA